MARPRTVTIVASLLIFMALSTTYVTLKYINDPSVSAAMESAPLPRWVQLAWTAIGVALLAGCGAAMLSGVNTGRLLYLWYTPMAIVLNAVIYGFSGSALIAVAVYLLFAFLLTRVSARNYFKGHVATGATPN